MAVHTKIHTALGIDEDSYLEVEHEHEIRLRKLVPARPLGDDDPIWGLLGAGSSTVRDGSGSTAFRSSASPRSLA